MQEGRITIEVENRTDKTLSVHLSGKNGDSTYPVTIQPGEIKPLGAEVRPWEYRVIIIDESTRKSVNSLSVLRSDKLGNRYLVHIR